MNSGDERIPPQDIPAERTVLGSMITSTACAEIGAGILEENDFYSSQNKKIFAAIRDMVWGERPTDLLLVAAELGNRGHLEAVGEEPYLAELCESMVVPANLPYYAMELREKAVRRQMVTTGYEMIGHAFDGEIGATEALCKADARLAELEHLNDTRDQEQKKSARILKAGDYMERMEQYRNEGGATDVVSTGWENLDKLYRPAKGTLNVIHGIPSHGKSSFMDALAINLSVNHGWRHLYFSPENFPLEYHLQKLIELFIGAPLRKYGDFAPCSAVDVKTATEFIHQHFSFIYLSEDAHNLPGLMRLIKKPVKEEGYDSLIIDPWNELDYSAEQHEKETDYIGKALSGLRRYGRRNDLAVFTLVHPAKMYKDKNAKVYEVPTMYHLSGSAHWFNKADNGICVYRDFEKETIQLHVQKIKYKPHGHIGLAQMKYLKESGRFIPHEEEEGGNWND